MGEPEKVEKEEEEEKENGKKGDENEKKTKKSSVGDLDENIAAALSYVLGPLTGILFFIMEKKSSFVKFHAMQSLITFGIIWILGIFLSIFSLLLYPLVMLLGLFLIFKAYKGEKYKIPGIGDFAEKQAKDLK